jgi:hypothetical protein
MFGTILAAVLSIVTALPNLITGIEAAFGKKSGQGSAKWIAVEQALSTPIQNIATQLANSVPNAKVDQISSEVAKFTKATNDAIVAFYNSVGWPTTTLAAPTQNSGS